MTIPQVRGMYAGDRARKKTLIDYGFRLPSAYDNRPLNFDEFYERVNQVVFVSATPGPFEREKSAPDRSICPSVGLTMTSGSKMPVGRMT